MTPEGRIEKYLRTAVKAAGGKVRKLRWIGRRGAPDDLVWFRPAHRRTALVECKAPGEQPTAQQLKVHRDMRADGWRVFVVYTAADVDQMIKEMLNR